METVQSLLLQIKLTSFSNKRTPGPCYKQEPCGWADGRRNLSYDLVRQISVKQVASVSEWQVGNLAPMRLGLTPTYTISSLLIEYSLRELGMGKKGDRWGKRDLRAQEKQRFDWLFTHNAFSNCCWRNCASREHRSCSCLQIRHFVGACFQKHELDSSTTDL